jgi:GTP-binding protein Era
MLAALSEARDFAALVPVSAKSRDGVDRVLDEVAALLPEGHAGYDESTLTDRPTKFFVREYVREQVLNATEGEVPHAVAVSVEEVSESTKIFVIKATIHVEKDGQRAILVGRGGAQIKEIGIGARKRLEELLDKKVHLELFVRVTPQWKSMPRQLAELGYERPTGGSDDSGDPS